MARTGRTSRMTRRKVTAIAILLLISLVGFFLAYDYSGACGKPLTGDLVFCFFRNASVTVIRALPLGLALLLLISGRR